MHVSTLSLEHTITARMMTQAEIDAGWLLALLRYSGHGLGRAFEPHRQTEA
jgi:hypothetical protein